MRLTARLTDTRGVITIISNILKSPASSLSGEIKRISLLFEVGITLKIAGLR